MKILFIIHNVYQDDNHFPLGPAYLTSILKNDGHTVETYCMDLYHYTNQQLATHLDHNTYDQIHLGFMAARFTETVLPLCKTINSHKKKAKFILGGPGPSATPEYILEKTNADSVVVGEAENIILDIKDGINNAHPPQNLDIIPFPSWESFPMDKYTTSIRVQDMSSQDKLLMILSSRGCVGHCTFCARGKGGLRLRSIPSVIDEISHLNKTYGVNTFVFADEFFTLSKKRLEEFKCLLQEKKLKIKYWCASRVNGINEEILALLKETGCILLNYGFESMSPEVLKEMKKNTTPEDNINAAELTKKAEIPFGLNFIWGFPSDTPETLQQSVNFIKKYNLYSQVRTIRFVTPYPGSELYYDAIKKGLLGGPDDFYNKFKNSGLITVNFTDMKTDDMYKTLFSANSELIDDHQKHTTMTEHEATTMKKGFYNLYFKGNSHFRGARHYGGNK